jgi:superfamily II DNA or RNA helicase
MSAPELRPYQDKGIAASRQHIIDGRKRVILCGPTGSGKTVWASAIIHSARRNFNAKILFVAHRIELIDQTVKQLEKWGVTEVGVIRADDKRTAPLMPVQVASIQTLARRELPWVPNIIFIDECHRSAAESYQKHIFEKFPEAVILGLTATPCRQDGKALGKIVGGPFDALEIAATYSDCIKDGFIAEPRCFSAPPLQRPDLSKVHTVAGDYDLGELEEVMTGEALIGGIYERWKEFSEGRKTVVFATGIQHSQAIVKLFLEKGVRAAHVDANTPDALRAEIGRMLRDGELEVVSNVGIYTEGWDEPSVKCIILARPTKSLVLYMQMCGRPLRPVCACGHVPHDHNLGACTKCGCLDMELVQPIILDHAFNFDRHGAPHEDRDWSLDVPPKRKSDSKFKTCPKCYAYIRSNARECPFCKHSFVVATPFVPKPEVDMPLVERQPVSEKRRFFDKLVREARSNGYKPGYASAKYKEEYGSWPPWGWSEEVKAIYASDVTWQGRLMRKEEWRAKKRREEETSPDDQLAELAAEAMKEWDA